MITAATITESEIKALRDEALGSGVPFSLRPGAYEILRATNQALGGARESTRRKGREYLAEVLNARGGK